VWIGCLADRLRRGTVEDIVVLRWQRRIPSRAGSRGPGTVPLTGAPRPPLSGCIHAGPGGAIDQSSGRCRRGERPRWRHRRCRRCRCRDRTLVPVEPEACQELAAELAWEPTTRCASPASARRAAACSCAGRIARTHRSERTPPLRMLDVPANRPLDASSKAAGEAQPRAVSLVQSSA